MHPTTRIPAQEVILAPVTVLLIPLLALPLAYPAWQEGIDGRPWTFLIYGASDNDTGGEVILIMDRHARREITGAHFYRLTGGATARPLVTAPPRKVRTARPMVRRRRKRWRERRRAVESG